MIDYDQLEREVKSQSPVAVDYDGLEQEVKSGAPPVTLQPEEKSVAGFGKNILTSSANLVSDIGKAVTSPVQTAKALGSLGTGIVAKMAPLDPVVQAGMAPNIEVANAVGEHFKNRYGSVGQALDTLYTDPAGFAADLSTIFSGAGGTLKAAGTIGRIAPLVKAGEVASEIGAVTDPVRAATLAAKVPLKVLPVESVAERMYQSALKPTGEAAERAQVVKTGLKEGVALGRGSVEKVQGLIDDINAEIAKGITAKAAQGKVIDTGEVVKRLDDLRKRFSNTTTPQRFIDQIDAIEKEFLASHGKQIPIQQAQEIKKNTGNILRKAYGELKTAEIEAQKGLVRGIKEEIVKEYPEISSLNARDSSLIQLEEALQKFVSRTSNKDIIGIGTPIVGGAVGAATGRLDAAGLAALAKSAIDNPYIKSRLAITLSKAGKFGPTRRSILTPLSVAGRVPISVEAE